MIKLAKILNDETGLCSIALGSDTEYFITEGFLELDVDFSDVDYNWYLADKCPHKSEEELIEKRKEQFAKEFFLTSLGYIRRNVTMKDGSHKDFLCDLLPTIGMGVNNGLTVNIIAYNEPDYTKDVEDWAEYQHTEVATTEFIQECMLRLSQDFGAI